MMYGIREGNVKRIKAAANAGNNADFLGSNYPMMNMEPGPDLPTGLPVVDSWYGWSMVGGILWQCVHMDAPHISMLALMECGYKTTHRAEETNGWVTGNPNWAAGAGLTAVEYAKKKDDELAVAILTRQIPRTVITLSR